MLYTYVKNFRAFIELESQHAIHEICKIVSYKEYPSGSIVFHQGDKGAHWYVILEGAVSVIVSGFSRPTNDPNELMLRGTEDVFTLKTGDAFGELALRNNSLRSATIKCKSDHSLIDHINYNNIDVSHNNIDYET